MQRPRRPSILLALGWYSAAIHRGIARYARQEDWILDIGMLRTGHFPPLWNGRGIICSLTMNPEVDAFVKKARIPTVNIGNQPHPAMGRVSSDNRAVGRLAAEYFLDRGFKNFAFYVRSRSKGELERLSAFRECIVSAGHRLHPIDWPAAAAAHPKGNTERSILPWLAKELSSLPKPLAVLSEFDDRAIEVINACIAGGIPVPEQVAVLGVDNDPLRCEFAPIPLSSIDDDHELIGYEAAALLGRMMKGERPSLIQVPPKGITTRHSTDILAIDHPLVASTLRMIWENYGSQVNAKSIAAAMPISYRRLHDAFMFHVGHSIATEITKKRVERAQQLLMETDKKSLEIALLAGFPNQERMSKVFKRLLKLTPASYRRRFRTSVAEPPASQPCHL